MIARLRVLWGQVRNPLMLLLLFAAAASTVTGQWVDALIVLAIVAGSVGIGYSREYRAGRAVAELRARALPHGTPRSPASAHGQGHGRHGSPRRDAPAPQRAQGWNSGRGGRHAPMRRGRVGS